VRFPGVERSDHVEHPLDGAPGQPDPVALQPLERAVVDLHHPGVPTDDLQAPGAPVRVDMPTRRRARKISTPI